MLKKFFYLILFIVILAIGAITTLVYVSIEDGAKVAVSETITGDELEQIRVLLKTNDPAAVLSNSTKNVTITPVQANQILAFLSQQYGHKIRARTIFDNNRAHFNISARLPDNPVGPYLNASVRLKIKNLKYLVVDKVVIGKIVIPKYIIDFAQPLIFDQIKPYIGEYYILWNQLNSIEINRQQATVHYRLERDDLDKLKSAVSSIAVLPETRTRIIAYSNELVNILNAISSEETSLINLLAPLFSFAEQRSQKNNQAHEENRAALLTMAAYITGKNAASFVSTDAKQAHKKIKFTLREREDLAKHYILSAALNVASGTRWSMAIGLKKELEDSDVGSGFSFVDLMADISGNKLAKAALNEVSAAKLQSKLKAISSEDMIIANIDNLPEGLNKEQFELQFGNAGSEEYIRVVREIERRLFSCAAYRY